MLIQELEQSWDPWRHLEQLQGALAQNLLGTRVENSTPYPALNAWTNDHEAIVTAEIPGIDPARLDIQVVGDLLTLRGERENEPLSGSQAWRRRERLSGEFTRSLQLPFQVDAERVTARAAHGVLTLTLPRADQEKPRKIAVKSV